VAAEKLGDGTCPLCRGLCRVSLSQKGLAVMTCNGCNMQLFTRSARSDEMARSLIRAEARQDAPKAEPAPIPSTPPVAPPVARAAPVAAPESRGFGLFKWTQ